MKKLYMFFVLVLSACCSFAAANLLDDAVVSTSQKNDEAPLMFDGKLDTKWRTFYAENAQCTISATFTEPVSFNAIALWGNNIVSSKIEISDDGDTWTSIPALKEITANQNWGQHYKNIVKTKNIRISLTGGPKKNAISVNELVIYSLDSAPSKALFAKITSKGQGENWRFPASLMVDGNTKTMYKPYSMWKGADFTVELDKEQEVKELCLKSSGTPSKVVVLTSMDGKDWKKAGESTGAKKTVVKFAAVKAKYVKAKVTAGKYLFISELEIN